MAVVESPIDGLGPGRREVPLDGGRVLVVRPMVPADADALGELYEGLSTEDRHRRFFSAYRPGPAFLHRWASLGCHGGGGLVAELVEQAGPGLPPRRRLVADAGYCPLPNGNGELAITVAPDWRGWLGPFLLDALIELARAAGIGSLEAEVLVENGPMLDLVRSRGFVVVGHPDPAVIRVAVGTGGPVPPWPPVHDRPRLLVECAGTRWQGEEAALEAGFQVITCPGPQPGRRGRRLGRRTCPLLAGGTCPLVDGADAIVVVMADHDPVTAALCQEHRAADRHVPVVVENENVAAAAGPRRADTVISAVREALDDAVAG